MREPRQYLHLRAAEIVALTGISERTVRRWIRDEVLPSTKVGGTRLVATADLEAVLSAPRGAVQESSTDEE
jgi:excisionase family DNA binding protein